MASPMYVWDAAGYEALLYSASALTTAEIEKNLTEITTNNHPLGKREHLRTSLLETWARRDGVAAMEYYLSHQKNWPNFQAGLVILRAWAQAKPDQALVWFSQHPQTLTPKESRQFEVSAITQLAISDLDSAISRAEMTSDGNRSRVLPAMAGIAVNDPDKLARFTTYLHTLDDSKARLDAAQSIISHLAFSEPDKAIAQLRQWPEKDQSAMVDTLAGSWGLKDPEKAMQWRLKQADLAGSDPKKAQRCVQNIFGNWARADTARARQWIENADLKNKDGYRKAAITRFTWQEDFSKALPWIENLSAEWMKANQYRSLYSMWASTDPTGASKWLKTLTEARRDGIVSGTRIQRNH